MISNKIKLFLLLFFLGISWVSCVESTAPQKKIEKDTVASGLKKSTNFERDTIRKDALRVEKKVKQPIEK